MELVAERYRQPRNLLVRFRDDTIDQSPRLYAQLQARSGDQSQLVVLPGKHTTPASAGLRQSILGTAEDPKGRRIKRLASQVLTLGQGLVASHAITAGLGGKVPSARPNMGMVDHVPWACSMGKSSAIGGMGHKSGRFTVDLLRAAWFCCRSCGVAAGRVGRCAAAPAHHAFCSAGGVCVCPLLPALVCVAPCPSGLRVTDWQLAATWRHQPAR